MLSRMSVFLTSSLISLVCQTSPSIASHARLLRGRHQQLAREVDVSELQLGVEARGDEVHDVTKRRGAIVGIPYSGM